MAPTPPAVTLLRRWLKLTERTQAGLATELGCSTALVEAWMAGRRRPSYELATTLESLTGGAVAVGSWARIHTNGVDNGEG